MFNAGSVNYSTKLLSKLSTSILSSVRVTVTLATQMVVWIRCGCWKILKICQSMSISSCNSIKTFDFSTLYTTISHSKLKHRMEELVQLCFLKKNGQRRCKYLVLGRDNSYFVKTTPILSKGFLKLIPSKCLSFWLITHLLCLVDSRHTYGYLLCIPSHRLVPSIRTRQTLFNALKIFFKMFVFLSFIVWPLCCPSSIYCYWFSFWNVKTFLVNRYQVI